MNNNLFIFGNTKFAEVAYYYFENHSDKNVLGFVVDEGYIKTKKIFGKEVYDSIFLEDKSQIDEFSLFIAVGYSNQNKNRKNLYEKYKKTGYSFSSYISEKSSVYSDNIGEHNFIFEDNTIQPFTKIGNNCVLWSGNHIGHHSIIKDHCFISSHVVISGSVEVGEQTFIGVNSTIVNDIKIGKNNFIGAGCLVTKSTNNNEKIKYNKIKEK